MVYFVKTNRRRTPPGPPPEAGNQGPAAQSGDAAKGAPVRDSYGKKRDPKARTRLK